MKVGLIILIVSIILFGCTQPEPAAQISISAQDVTSGETFYADVAVSNMPEVSGVQFKITFDPASLEFIAAEQGPFLSSDGTQLLFFVLNHSATTREVIISRMSGSTSGSGLLARISFSAKSSGKTTINLHDSLFTNTAAEAIIAEEKDSILTIR